MKKGTKIVIVLAALVLIGFLGYNYIMTAGARDLENEKSEYTVSAISVSNEFSTDPKNATTKYLNKAVEITGKVTSVNENVITLDEKISCQLKSPEKVEVGTQVNVKGRVTGYDDLFEELKLDQCLIVK